MPSSFTHDVVTIGSAMVDEFAMSPGFELKKNRHAPDGFDACVPLGAKVSLDDLRTDTGGGATNAVVTFRRLGFKSASIFRVGDDLFGDLVVKRLREENVDVSLVQRDAKYPTGRSLIFVSGHGWRSILMHRGANDSLDPKKIPWKRLLPRWFYVTGLGGRLGALSLLLTRAEAVGSHVAWNPGRGELEKGLSRLTSFINRTDILILNREEAAMLARKPPRHLRQVIDVLSPLPKIALVVSDGSRGAYLTSCGKTWFCPALPGTRVNTTGAGDALGSGLVAGFLQTCDLSVAFKVGMLNATGVVTHMGAKTGILRAWPTSRELTRVKIRLAK